MYARHLINGLSSTAIGRKTALEVWSRKTAQDPGLLREFGSPAYFSAKDSKVNPRAKMFVFLGVNRNMKGYKLWDPKNKKIVMSRDVTFDETSMMKPTSSQPVESGQTNEVSQRVNSDTTPRSLEILIPFEFSPEVTHDDDHVDDEDTEDVENLGSEMVQVQDFIAAEKNYKKST